jgi:hypothetical protein
MMSIESFLIKTNITIHKDSQGRATVAHAQFGVNVPFAKGSFPANL